MSFELVGFGDIGSMHTGVHRDQSRAVLGEEFEEFYKIPDSTVPTDAYDDLGVHVYFDEGFTIIGLEFLKWSDLSWRGQRLSGADVLEVQQHLVAQGEVLNFNSTGFDVDGLGLRVYAPDIGEEDAVIETVYVSFVKNK
ncbi:hypothetical protein [Pseudomonas sp. R1-7]|uniref:hypothetical protein n=1 Tax=Pseudomonas sp. R1-7 TaxID=2817398 RepID=UPI003DA9405D